jgi:hypothetical protein
VNIISKGQYLKQQDFSDLLTSRKQYLSIFILLILVGINELLVHAYARIYEEDENLNSDKCRQWCRDAFEGNTTTLLWVCL